MNDTQKQALKEYIEAYETVFVRCDKTSDKWDLLDKASDNLDKHFAKGEVPGYYKGAYNWAKKLLQA